MSIVRLYHRGAGVTLLAPSNTSVPTISGSAVEGATLTVGYGEWSQRVDSYTVQWKADGTNITDATSVTYVLTATEVGKVITIAVVATNAGGSSSAATSAATSAVSAAGAVGDISNLSAVSNVPTTAVLTYTVATNAVSHQEAHATPQGSGNWTTAATLGENNTVTGLAESTPYDFRVRGVNGQGTAGNWSNTATATTPAGAGLTVNISYDASWAVQPSGLTSDLGSLSYPNVGFADQATVDAATALIEKWVTDFKALINSTGTINLKFGASRYQSANSGNFLAYGVQNPGSPATHSEKGVAFADYAAYAAAVGAMDADQKPFWPLPGAMPPTFSNLVWSTTHKAIVESGTDSQYTSIVFNTKQKSFDWSQNTTTCEANKIKAYRLLWHEVTQAVGRMNIGGLFPGAPMFRMLMFYNSTPTWWGSQSSGYISLDSGATSLGAIATGAGQDHSDFAVAEGGPFSYEPTPVGSTNQLHQPRDYKVLCALYPPSDTCKTLAGL